MSIAEAVAMTNEVQINRLAGSLGAELRGLNLASLSPAGLAIIDKALIDHHVVAVRDQRVTPAELDAFAKMLGAPHVYPQRGLRSALEHPEFPDITVLRNEGYVKAVTNNWHSEGTAFSTPPAITLLAAHILPSAGGDTGFANQHLAFEALSPRLQQMLSSMRAYHEVAYASGSPYSAVHPVVRTHPVTGRRALYVNKYFTKYFEGMSIEESRPLLAYLEAHCVREEFVYRHRWQLGDVVFWDNRSVQHRAIQDYGAEERVMYHMELKDEVPE
jgi:taurine dioxygenase